MGGSHLSGPPSVPVALPGGLEQLLAGDDPTCVWRNEAGGLTFALAPAGGPPRRYLKWAPAGTAASLPLRAEAERLRWAAAFTPVPRVLGEGGDADGEWLLTAALPGRSAVEDPWRARPADAVRAVGRGLRALHDALPVAACPWRWSAGSRLARVREAAERGVHPRRELPVGPDRLSLSEALARLADVPDDDLTVVCHGDACAPNTLVDTDGGWAGHVDLGRLGVGDRWADLAVATWSTEWNYGPGWERPLLEAYGVEPDPARTAWYRLLWDASPD
ncbi:MAG: aminoglycoside 3'-phosphotransferase [Kineosporiaceae bacterium]